MQKNRDERAPQGPLFITGATILDAVHREPLLNRTLIIDGGRIRDIRNTADIPTFPGSATIDATGKYVIPGLMNANVHLFSAITVERLSRHQGNYEDVIIEAAQIALRGGMTTVFDTWGPRRHLMNVRDRINQGHIPGSRIYCAGNIVGFDGPLSADFTSKGMEVASADLIRRVNSVWAENVGRHLMWLTPPELAKQVRAYIDNGIDFLKYASNEHGAQAAGAFLEFSPRAQRAIVDEAHRAGITAQAHCMTVEGLRCAMDAGCDLITHCNITGPTPIPGETLELFVDKKIGAVIFPFTQRRLDWLFGNASQGWLGTELMHTMYRAADLNVRNLIRSGATLLMANDAFVLAPEFATDPGLGQWLGIDVDNYLDLTDGHFFWFKAMEEKGCAPIEILRAATINIARAYGVDHDLGTIEEGKVADLLILEDNPLAAADNYRKIVYIIKDGYIVDRESLPTKRVLTCPPAPPEPEENLYVPLLKSGTLPMHPMCMCSITRSLSC